MAGTSVFLNVQDLERSLAFYRALGFKTVRTWKGEKGTADYVDLALGPAEIGLGRIASNDDPEYRAWVSTPLGAGVLVYVEVADADKLWQRAQKAGLTVESPLRDRSYGRAFTLNDPDGYVITVLGPVKAARAAPRRASQARKGPAKRATGRPKAKKAARRGR